MPGNVHHRADGDAADHVALAQHHLAGAGQRLAVGVQPILHHLVAPGVEHVDILVDHQHTLRRGVGPKRGERRSQAIERLDLHHRLLLAAYLVQQRAAARRASQDILALQHILIGLGQQGARRRLVALVERALGAEQASLGQVEQRFGLGAVAGPLLPVHTGDDSRHEQQEDDGNGNKEPGAAAAGGGRRRKGLGCCRATGRRRAGSSGIPVHAFAGGLRGSSGLGGLAPAVGQHGGKHAARAGQSGLGRAASTAGGMAPRRRLARRPGCWAAVAAGFRAANVAAGRRLLG